MFSSIKTWFNLTQPNGGLMFFRVLFKIIERLLLISLTIPAAKIIACANLSDFIGAKRYIKIELILALSFCFFAILSSILNAKNENHIVKNVEKKLINNITQFNPKNFKRAGKNQLINILSHSAINLSEYEADFVDFFGNLCQLIFILTIIATADWFLSLILAAICLILLIFYIFLTFIEHVLVKNSQILKDENLAASTEVINGLPLVYDLNLKSEIQSVSLNSVQKLSKHINKESFLASLKEIFVYAFSSLALAATTFYLVYLLRLDYLTLTIFILTIPYLTQALNITLSCYNIISKTKNIKIECEIVNRAMNLNEKIISNFGNNITDLLAGNLVINHLNIDYAGQPIINNFSHSFVKNSLNNLIFNKTIQQNEFISVLKRHSKPASGTITIDSINIFDFTESVFPHNISFVSQTPFFFKNSILENLKLTGATKREIFSALRLTKTYQPITMLPSGVNSTPAEISSPLTLYLLTIARSILTKAEIIILDGFPTNLPPAETELVIKLLIKLSKTKTIVVCSTYPIESLPGEKIYCKQ